MFNISECIIFCDFDGTITREDCIDKLLTTYADSRWEEIEELWKQNKIGSCECLTRQLDCIESINPDELEEFINNLEIDPYFPLFAQKIEELGIKFQIVSDGFDIFINALFSNNNIPNLTIFCNSLVFLNHKPLPIFPYQSDRCMSKSGLCKCKVVNRHKSDKFVIYIGDGKSDICAAKHADLIFAKATLAKYCHDNSLNYTEFSDFSDIIENLFKEEKKNAINASQAYKIAK